jgi:hypothetical protein
VGWLAGGGRHGGCGGADRKGSGSAPKAAASRATHTASGDEPRPPNWGPAARLDKNPAVLLFGRAPLGSRAAS